MSTKVFLITHAVTEWHLKGKVQGHIDTPLNSYGMKMAEMVAQRLMNEEIHVIYTSDLKRAYQTAEPISKLKSIKIITDKKLREGRWKVPSTDEYPLLPYEVEKESLLEVRNRVVDAVTKIAKDNDNKSILVISHEGAVKQFIEHLRSSGCCDMSTYKGIRSSINCFEYNESEWRCLLIGNT